MLMIQDSAQLRALIRQWRSAGERVAFVPTMGNLHQGHLQLVDTAKQRADRVIVSIFVNPMQFGANEDLDKYPRTLEQDCKGLTEHGADAVFTPTPQLIYPRGASRAGHFRGVSTIVTKLFNLVQPDIACFGQKDYQQLAIIRQMVTDLSMPIEIIGVPTTRAEDGLALSSRNGYLTAEQRTIAPALYRTLQWMKQQLHQGFSDLRALEQQAKDLLNAAGFKADYVNISDRQTLVPASDSTTALVILAAAYLGTTRLIDNIEV
jgi:pantoate--beta-alanine ligase